MAVSTGAICANISCHNDAEVIIRITGTGKRPVCDRHASDGEVLCDV